MNSIEWVQVPECEFVTGLSDAQREALHRRIWADYGVDEVDPSTRAAIESLALRFRRGAHFEDEDLTPEERRVLPDPFDARTFYFSAEGLLGRIPQQERVWLPTFYIARYPITHAQASEFFRDSGAARITRGAKDLPEMPEELHAATAIKMMDWLNARFPTTLEWEKAARGSDGRLYPWGDEWDPSRCNLSVKHRPEYSRRHGVPRTAVDAYPRGVSPYGVWDMVGNLREWVKKPLSGEGRVTDPNQLAVKGESPGSVNAPECVWALPARTNGSGFRRGGDGGIGLRPVVDRIP